MQYSLIAYRFFNNSFLYHFIYQISNSLIFLDTWQFSWFKQKIWFVTFRSQEKARANYVSWVLPVFPQHIPSGQKLGWVMRTRRSILKTFRIVGVTGQNEYNQPWDKNNNNKKTAGGISAVDESKCQALHALKRHWGSHLLVIRILPLKKQKASPRCISILYLVLGSGNQRSQPHLQVKDATAIYPKPANPECLIIQHLTAACFLQQEENLGKAISF